MPRPAGGPRQRAASHLARPDPGCGVVMAVAGASEPKAALGGVGGTESGDGGSSSSVLNLFATSRRIPALGPVVPKLGDGF